MLKKVLSIILTIAVISCLFVTGAAADTADSTPVIREGAVYEITYENPGYPTRDVTEEQARTNSLIATDLIMDDILACSYAEFFRYEPNKIIAGLPVDSIDKIKEISYQKIPYIEDIKLYDPFTACELSPEEKLSDELKTLAEEHGSERIQLEVTLNYDPDTVYVGAKKDEFENPMDYEALKRDRINTFRTNTNQQCFEKITETVDAEMVKDYRYYAPASIIINAPADEIMTIAEMDIVAGLKTIDYDPSVEPTEPPIERPDGLYFITVQDDGISKAYSNKTAVVKNYAFLFAEPADGYRFVRWQLSGNYRLDGNLNDLFIPVYPLSDITAVAVFEKESVDPIDPKDYRYTDRFEAFMADQNIEKAESDDAPINYGEKLDYRAYKELAVTDDWALIQAHVTGMKSPWDVRYSIVFADRILTDWEAGVSLYPYGLFVYDAGKDTFFAIDKVDPKDYAGISDVMESLKIGRPLGDADCDQELTILDATAIQRDLADLEDLPQNDLYTLNLSTLYYYADMDSDGEVTILDATAIQRHLVGLDQQN